MYNINVHFLINYYKYTIFLYVIGNIVLNYNNVQKTK